MHHFQGGAAQDVVVGDLGGIEAEELQRLDDHHHAGDDRGGAVGVQAADLAALRLGQRGEAREDAPARGQGHHVAVDAVGRITLQIEVYRAQRRRGARRRRSPRAPSADRFGGTASA